MLERATCLASIIMRLQKVCGMPILTNFCSNARIAASSNVQVLLSASQSTPFMLSMMIKNGVMQSMTKAFGQTCLIEVLCLSRALMSVFRTSET